MLSMARQSWKRFAGRSPLPHGRHRGCADTEVGSYGLSTQAASPIGLAGSFRYHSGHNPIARKANGGWTKDQAQRNTS